MKRLASAYGGRGYWPGGAYVSWSHLSGQLPPDDDADTNIEGNNRMDFPAVSLSCLPLLA